MYMHNNYTSSLYGMQLCQCNVDDNTIKFVWYAFTYINIILCLKFIGFVFEVKRVKPLKQWKVQAKRDIGAFPDGWCKFT